MLDNHAHLSSLSPEPVLGGVPLFTLEPDLTAQLTDEERGHAARMTLPGFDLPEGDLELDALCGSDRLSGRAWGLYVAQGLLLTHVQLHRRQCSRLLIPGDLMLLGDVGIDAMSERSWWTVRREARIALFDTRMITAIQRWPQLLREISERSAISTRREFVDRAISQLPVASDRLLAFLWTIAESQGRVRRDGVWIELPLTHKELGSLIGGRRSTVSLAARSLAELGLARPERGGWLLSHGSLDALHDEIRSSGHEDDAAVATLSEAASPYA